MSNQTSQSSAKWMWLVLPISASLALLACSTLTGLPGSAETTPEEGFVEGGASQDVTPQGLEPTDIECPPGGKEDNLLMLFPDMLEMNLLTDVAGGGQRPLLEWEPVDEAVSYALVVYDSTGEPYWAWLGYETAIYVAGTTEPPPADGEGPIISECMTWITTAYDAEGVPIAAGGPRPLSP